MSKQVQDAYIVAATRTPVGKAPKGVFRNTRPDDMLAHVLKAVVAQAPGIDTSRIDDAIIGCAMPEGEQGMNVARIGVLLAGLPDTVAAQTINRFCSSGLQAVALAANEIRLGNADLMLAGGTESMSMVPMMGNKVALSPSVFRDDHVAIAYGMGITAEKVAEEWKVSREAQDAFALLQCVFVVADHRLFQAQIVQQPHGHAGVLGGHEVRRAEGGGHAGRHVVQIADGGCHDIKNTGHD